MISVSGKRMRIEIVKSIIESSAINLLKTQPDVLQNTHMTTMTEWNMGHHYATEIDKYLFWLRNDVDVVKRNYDNRRPDIIFHKRNVNRLNTLVVEIKIQESIDTTDETKIKQDWMRGKLKYRYGACVSFRRGSIPIGRLFSRDASLELDFVDSELLLPTRNEAACNEINRFVERIDDQSSDEMVEILLQMTDALYS